MQSYDNATTRVQLRRWVSINILQIVKVHYSFWKIFNTSSANRLTHSNRAVKYIDVL